MLIHGDREEVVGGRDGFEKHNEDKDIIKRIGSANENVTSVSLR